jgi:hypothetical protein
MILARFAVVVAALSVEPTGVRRRGGCHTDNCKSDHNRSESHQPHAGILARQTGTCLQYGTGRESSG